jgi:branched-chain amino acid transport system ATP-binding protein
MSAATSNPLLQVQDLKVNFGHVQAVKGIDFELHEGQITTLVGANGAGKSTTLLALSGLVKKASGRVMFAGQDIGALSPHKIVAGGVVQVAEGRATLTTLTVRENLELGAYTRRDGTAARIADLERIYALFPVLKDRADGLAGNLSGGEQQILEMAMVLLVEPALLLLDEPSLGLSPRMQGDVFATVQRIAASGVTVLIVEQNVRGALLISDRALVMEQGRLFMEGPAAEVRTDPRIRQAYLGGNIQQTAA